MSQMIKSTENKFKRRSFFAYGAVAVASLFTIGKIPLNKLRDKVLKQSSLKIKENPFSVRRDNQLGR